MSDWMHMILKKHSIVVWVFAFVVLAIGLVQAQQSINTHNFKFGDTLETLQVEDALGEHSERVKYAWLFRLSYDFVDEPFVAINQAGNAQLFKVVEHMHSLSTGASFMLNDKLLLGASIPLHIVELGQVFAQNTVAANELSLGDMQLYAKYRINDAAAKWSFAIMTQLGLPTAKRSLFVSDDSVSLAMHALGSGSIGRVKVFANAGYVFANKAQFLNVDRHKRVELSAAAHVPLDKQESLALIAENLYSVGFPGFDKDQNLISWRLALRAKVQEMRLFLGAGISSLRKARSHDVSVFAGIKLPLGFAANSVDRPQLDVESELESEQPADEAEPKKSM